MAPRWFGRRHNGGEAGEPVEEKAADTADLGAAEHAWWAQREVVAPWTPPRPRPDEPPERDVLADHFGPDWRETFGLPRDGEALLVDELAERFELDGDPLHASDAYEVLQVSPDASWEEIVDAHRRMARRHHPDRLVGRPASEIALAEERIRVLNAAYAELKVRRGR